MPLAHVDCLGMRLIDDLPSRKSSFASGRASLASLRERIPSLSVAIQAQELHFQPRPTHADRTPVADIMSLARSGHMHLGRTRLWMFSHMCDPSTLSSSDHPKIAWRYMSHLASTRSRINPWCSALVSQSQKSTDCLKHNLTLVTGPR